MGRRRTGGTLDRLISPTCRCSYAASHASASHASGPQTFTADEYFYPHNVYWSRIERDDNYDCERMSGADVGNPEVSYYPPYETP